MRFKIFISSVQSEFAAERRLLVEYIRRDALLGVFFEPFIFEEANACDRSPKDVYLHEVEDCDIYLGLLGRKFGHEVGPGVSATESEYDLASKLGKTRLVFLKEVAKREPEEQRFVEKVQKSVTRKSFADFEGLQLSVYGALIRYLEQSGYVRVTPFDASFDTGLTIDDVDQDKVGEYLQKARDAKKITIPENADVRWLLEKLEALASDGRISNAAVLLFAKDPQCKFISSEVKCLQYWGDVVERPIPSYRILHGGLVRMIEDALAFVMARIDHEVGEPHRQSGAAPGRDELPYLAVREAIVNAVCHRDYEDNGSVQVMLFKNRLEIINPGTLPKGWTVEKLLQTHESKARNLMIAKALNWAGYVEKSGNGTESIINRCMAIGLPKPEYHPDNADFKAIIWRKSKSGVLVKALDGVSLKLPDKGMVFILGKSGSGKSTLLNVLGGLDKFDEGDIVIKGKSSKDFKQKDFDSYRNTYLGFIFQEYNLLDNFTVGQNVALAMKLQGVKPTSEQINEILKEVDLNGLGDRKPNELSGGQKQRVAIARALIKNPQIIMADEPTGALDSKTGIQIFDTLKKLSKTKLVLIVSHDREFSERYADRIIELKDGKIISDVSASTSNKKTSDDITYLADEIKVKQGYTITNSDLKEINKFLKHNKGDVRIKSIKDSISGKTKFVQTDEKKIKSNDNDFVSIKSRLPLSHAFKMGMAGLKHKKFKLALTVFLSLVSFVMLGLSSTLMLFNGGTCLTDNWNSNTLINYYNIGKFGVQKSKGFFGSTYYSSVGGLFSDELNQIDKIFPLKDYTILLDGCTSEEPYSSSISFSNNIGNLGGDYNYNVYSNSFNYIGNSSSFNNKFNLLDGGSWPSTEKEVAIPLYIAETFIKYGYNEDGLTGIIPISDPKQLIGKKLGFSGQSIYGEYKITGIFKTELDLNDPNFSHLIDVKEVYNATNGKEFMDLKTHSVSNAVVFSDTEYNNLKNSGSHGYIYGKLPTNKNDLKNLADFTFKERDIKTRYFNTCAFLSQDIVSTSVLSVVQLSSSMKNVFLIIGLVFIVFSGLLLASFISNSISYQRKEIGILRAIGSRSSDVFKIYMSESFVIACFNFIVATIATSAILKFGLSGAVSSVMQGVNVFNFGIIEILIIFGTSFISAILSTFLPVYNTAKKKPVEAIRNK